MEKVIDDDYSYAACGILFKPVLLRGEWQESGKNAGMDWTQFPTLHVVPTGWAPRRQTGQRLSPSCLAFFFFLVPSHILFRPPGKRLSRRV